MGQPLCPFALEMAPKRKAPAAKIPTSVPPESWKGRTCALCKKPLVAIGQRRKNGKQGHDDWIRRKYHKACAKLVDL